MTINGSIKLVDCRLLRNYYLLFPRLLCLLQLLRPLVAGSLVGGPICDLALFGAVPRALAFGAAFEGLFLALGALEALS